MENKVIPGVLGVFVVICLVGGMLVPIIDGMVEGESTVNPDAGWIRMNYDTAAGSTYTVTITPGDDGITVANGSDTQTGSDDTIFYADSNVAVWMQDGTVNILGQNTDGPQFLQPEEAITITRTAEGVTVASGGDSLSFAAPAWAYVPFSSGSYGYFTDGTATNTNGKQIAAVGGGFAGVYAYNDITRYAGLGLQLQTVTEDGKLTGAYWAKPAEADSLSITPFDPGSITIQPLDPSILDPQPDASIMSVPTPTYTDGEWGYDVYMVGGVQKARIVSYSGSGGDIVVPATVGGYDVHCFGKATNPNSESGYQVFDNSTLSANSTLTLPDGIKIIGVGACMQCSNIVSVSIPKSVTNIGRYAFQSSGLTNMTIEPGSSLDMIYAYAFSYTPLTGSLILPDGLTKLGGFAFSTCSALDGTLLIPQTVSSFVNTPFDGTKFVTLIVLSDYTPTNNDYAISTLTEVLDLADNTDFSVTRCGIPAAATVQDNIGDSAGYIGVAYIAGESPLGEGATAILMAVPVLVIFSLIVAALVIFLKRSY